MNIGDKLPEILGKDQDGNEIRTADYAGRKFILYAYPKDNTSGCTAEACSLRDHREQLRSLGYDIIGVSKDSEASHKKFIEKQELNFPLIADTDTTLLQQLGAWGEKNMYGKKTMGTLRTTYLIDENGRVADIFTPKQIKTKEHAQQIIDRVSKEQQQ
ncbi:MAG: thioredoxin-dependent thiol peroxidase [Barnesiella sp.]|nr:thioredoxin-dependent thiol peroxidase [Bacteroidales bacterium]MBD5247049.1 thioredoxin-dependent thiol peroxidase [Barnesiella sp.]